MDNIPPTRIQQRLNLALNCVIAHAVVVVIVLLDILVITILLVTDLCVAEDFIDHCTNCTVLCTTYQRVNDSQFVISGIQLAILCGFLLEVILRILANIPFIRHDRWQVFDASVVMITFIVCICLLFMVSWHASAYAVMYLISLRLWRIGRIYHAVQEAAINNANIQIKTAADCEDKLKKAEHRINLQKRQMERLELAMLFFKSLAYSTQTSIGNHSRSLPALPEVREEVKAESGAAVDDSRSSFHFENLSTPYAELKQGTSSFDVPDILGNRCLRTLIQGNQDTGCGSARESADDQRYDQPNTMPISNSLGNHLELTTSPHSKTDLDPTISSTTVGCDPNLQTLESYLRSLLHPDSDSAYFNCTYIEESPSEHPSSMQSISDDIMKIIIPRLNEVPFPFDHTISYLSQDGIPMTDL